MRYKVGDKVMVCPELVEGVPYPMEDDLWRDSFTGTMVDFKGKVVTIKRASGTYRIEEDNGEWNWTDEMFIGITEAEVVDVALGKWEVGNG